MSGKQRIDYAKAAPQGYAAMSRLNSYVGGCGLEHFLLELVKTRASQINGWPGARRPTTAPASAPPWLGLRL